MGVSKVKSTKQKRRLADRIAGYEKSMASVPPQQRAGYKKPGSNKK
jgi:hypothetical protein